MQKYVLISALFLFFHSIAFTENAKAWRGGWASYWKDTAEQIKLAKKLGFNGLIFNLKKPEKIEEICDLAEKENIEIYAWYTIISNKENKELSQVMSDAENKRLEIIKSDKSPGRNRYQSGGEPFNKEGDVLLNELLCFHRPEVLALCKKQLEEILQKYPRLAGIGFDYFGYRNYKCCNCPVSEKMFNEYYEKLHKDNKDISREKALEKFSLDTLTAFVNELAAYVRKIKPGCKTAIHIYPTFIPEPVYGNRLDVDYCMQTAAWYFEPFWGLDKVDRYTKIIVNDANRYFKRQSGIPFVGIYMRPGISKPPERFREELKTIRKTGTQSFSICPFNIFLEHPELAKILLEELGVPK
ncbi:MAG: hypothetical protein A2017_09510 [Lentisphaerae bacterium GWF2_44_16]|nr:MAG: hypothetical protein A2017_09510 [Lentisphaerae bacterium GWF2_44_16]